MDGIQPCLWFNGNGEEAVQFYTSLFKNSRVGKKAYCTKSVAEVSGNKEGSVLTVEFEIEGLSILALNGGPDFKHTPAFSFFVWCENEQEITKLWNSLSEGGTVRMGLDKYPWSERYGWTADKYGVEWQLMLSPTKERKIAPAFLFVDQLFGKGQEAVDRYLSIFPNSKIKTMHKDENTKTIAHCVFELDGQEFALMEGPGQHGYGFSMAFSLIVRCANQKEIDTYWDKLLAGGGQPSQCGWLTDKYGVAWQITPTKMAEMAADRKKSEQVMKAMLKMRKLDLPTLEKAYAE